MSSTSTVMVPANSEENKSIAQGIKGELWPLDEIDPKNAKFPCCLVWTPLLVVSWLAPLFGHVGLCKEDGAVIDFSGSSFVNVNDFAYGAVAKYLQLDRKQVLSLLFSLLASVASMFITTLMINIHQHFNVCHI